MPDKTLYLHIGMPKCATTSIQLMLDAAREDGSLAEHGLAYPRLPGDTSYDQGNALALFFAIHENDWKSAFKIADRLLDTDRDVVLSNELMVSLGRADSLAHFLDHVRKKGFDVRVICFFRRQDYWIESDFKQHIKGGTEWTPSIHELLRKRTERRTLNYDWLMDKWEAHVGRERIDVVGLREGAASGAALDKFCELIGYARSQNSERSARSFNVSPRTGLFEPARLLRLELQRNGLKPAELKQYLANFFERAPSIVEPPRRKFLLPLDRRERLVERFSKMNDRLSRRFCNGNPLFDAEVEEHPDSECNLREEAAAYLAQLIVKADLFQADTHARKPSRRLPWAR